MPDLIVIDLEWNTAGRKSKVPASEAARMPFEIMEIGAAKVNGQLDLVDTFHRRVIPVLYREIQYHIAKVTQRTQESLGEGDPFPRVAADFFAFAGPRPILASWGTSDPEVLISNLRFHGLEPEAGFQALNLQAVFSRLAEGTGRGNQRSIEYALDFFQLDKDLPFHEAKSDAVYAARILQATLAAEAEKRPGQSPQALLKAYLYNPFLKSQSEEQIRLDKKDDPLDILRGHPLACPACGQALTGDWTQIKPGKSWFALGSCPAHGSVELLARRSPRSRVPLLLIRTRIPQGPVSIPQAQPLPDSP